VKERELRLSVCSMLLAENARRLAIEGNTIRAMRSTALAEALNNAANGDGLGKKLALKDAKFLRQAERRRKNV
jgi:hypothetical protein